MVEKSYKGDQAIAYETTIKDKIYTPKKPSDLSELYTFKGWANKKVTFMILLSIIKCQQEI